MGRLFCLLIASFSFMAVGFAQKFELNHGDIVRFGGVGSWAGKYWVVNGTSEKDVVRFVNLPATPNEDEKARSSFRVGYNAGGMTFESVKFPGNFLYVFRPGVDWMLGIRKGPVGSNTDFNFDVSPNPITRQAGHITMSPVKNSLWTVGCGFPNGIGMHMPGVFGYTKEGGWMGTFAPDVVYRAPKNSLANTTWTIESVGGHELKGTMKFNHNMTGNMLVEGQSQDFTYESVDASRLKITNSQSASETWTIKENTPTRLVLGIGEPGDMVLKK